MIIYKKYNWEFSKKNILEKVYKNKLLIKEISGNTSYNTDEIMFFCEEFDSIKNFIITEYFNIKKIDKTDYAFNMWSYIQNKNSTTPDYRWHTHKNLDGGRTELQTDYTFVFYLQIPINLKKGEGDLLIRDENGIVNRIVPLEGDIIFFKGNLSHVPENTPNAEIDRVVIAGNISSDFICNKKNVI